MSGSEQFGRVVDRISGMHEGRSAWPDVFSSGWTMDVPSALATIAQQVAASREYAGELLSRARKDLSVAEAMFSALEHDAGVEWDRAVDGQRSKMIAHGAAWGEREASANLSVLDRRVELRGFEMRLRNARGQVRELEDVFQAWRDTEWALDRQARLLSLRHQLGEV